MSHGLNPEQLKAVHTLRGPLLVLAGAGSGKTRVVTYRIAELIRHGTKPDRILAVTFTNKAAAEMQERISGLLGNRLKAKPTVSTFHSHCVRILRRHIRRLGYPEKFAIYDSGDQESIARNVLREIRVPTDALRPSDLLMIISGWKSKSIRPGDAAGVARTDKEHLAAVAYRRYQTALKNAGAVDFDDLLLCTEDLFSQFGDVRQDEASRFDHLLVDEYQDTNGSQYRIIKALARDHRNLCVVGDDDQSIYGWRGAEVEHILRFQHDWPEAKVVQLLQNYRSTAAILEIANRVIAFNKKRHPKVLEAARPGGERPRIEQFPDENEEAIRVVADIERRLKDPGVEPREFAILFRTNEQPRPFEMELRNRKLPYVILGASSFFDRKEVRDLMAYLRVLESPRDEVSLLRILNTPPRGIGSGAVEKLMAQAVSSGISVWEVMQRPEQAGLKDQAIEAVQRFTGVISQFRQRLDGKSLAAVARDLIAKIDYQGELRRVYPTQEEQEMRWRTVEEVVNSLATYEQHEEEPTLSGFLDSLALGEQSFGNDKEKQLSGNAIALMTLHAAKGLEFPYVYMVGLEEGILPHHRSLALEGDAIDEERRLCYVGITRAQERLTLSLPLTRMKWGKPRDTIPSRFLFEITGQAENFIQHRSNPHLRPKAAAKPKRPAAKKKSSKGKQ